MALELLAWGCIMSTIYDILPRDIHLNLARITWLTGKVYGNKFSSMYTRDDSMASTKLFDFILHVSFLFLFFWGLQNTIFTPPVLMILVYSSISCQFLTSLWTDQIPT